jgi:hypothetical protein
VSGPQVAGVTVTLAAEPDEAWLTRYHYRGMAEPARQRAGHGRSRRRSSDR